MNEREKIASGTGVYGGDDDREPIKQVSREEKLQKMSVVQAFMEQSGLNEKELHALFHECLFAAIPFPFDILYADGTVSKMPDLSKEAVAVKVSYAYWGGFWLGLKTSYPQRLTVAETRQYVDELPAINGKKWRLPTLEELEYFFDRRGNVFLVRQLCRFFEMPSLFEIGEGDPDGRFVHMRTSDGYGLCPFFPGVRSGLNSEDAEYCWPVLSM